MNTWKTVSLGAAVLAVGLSLSSPSASAQATAQLSQEQAVKEYPELIDQNSKFHRKFVERYQYLKSQSDPRVQRDDWPMALAKGVAEELHVKSKSEMAAEKKETETPAASIPAGTSMTVDGVVFQRIPEGIIVDCGTSGGSAHAKGRVFLRKGVAAEGETIHLPGCIAEGTYIYTDSAGAKHVLDAFNP